MRMQVSFSNTPRYGQTISAFAKFQRGCSDTVIPQVSFFKANKRARALSRCRENAESRWCVDKLMRTPTFSVIMPPVSPSRTSITKVRAWRLMRAFFCHFRTAHETSETFAEYQEQPAGREEAQDGLQRRTTGQA